jgi:hypothetical protein
MFDHRYIEDITIRKANGYVDGKPQYSESPGKALITDFSQRDINRFGNIGGGQIFMVKADTAPEIDSQITHNGKIYDLKGIKVCRDLDGRIECYRCAVVSGGANG